jgi:hypothetical protein
MVLTIADQAVRACKEIVEDLVVFAGRSELSVGIEAVHRHQQ